MTIVAKAAELDAYLSGLMITFLGAKATPAFAMFDAIHQTAQNAGLRAIAKTVLSKEDHDLFSALLLLRKTAEGHRNRLAHWIWAYSEDIEDGLLLIDPPDNFAFAVRNYERLSAGQRFSGGGDGPDRSKILVYTKQDLQDAVEMFDRVQSWFMVFKTHVDRHLQTEPLLYRVMLSDTEFRQALARVPGAALPPAPLSPRKKRPRPADE
ncbi:hypothetical protein [Brevundimonas sp.]|uniref:hypothetical protein n=1 Tax=Brevundimonas sp. TaxID=1871086 RepID=UPI002D66CA81|nr:hypothetical protein [Brevundimonas sp.]HYC98717.1 hypothetical protein [Brevundimonas sp.]